MCFGEDVACDSVAANPRAAPEGRPVYSQERSPIYSSSVGAALGGAVTEGDGRDSVCIGSRRRAAPLGLEIHYRTRSIDRPVLRNLETGHFFGKRGTSAWPGGPAEISRRQARASGHGRRTPDSRKVRPGGAREVSQGSPHVTHGFNPGPTARLPRPAGAAPILGGLGPVAAAAPPPCLRLISLVPSGPPQGRRNG